MIDINNVNQRILRLSKPVFHSISALCYDLTKIVDGNESINRTGHNWQLVAAITDSIVLFTPVSSTGQALSLSKGAVVVRQAHHERLIVPRTALVKYRK